MKEGGERRLVDCKLKSPYCKGVRVSELKVYIIFTVLATLGVVGAIINFKAGSIVNGAVLATAAFLFGILVYSGYRNISDRLSLHDTQRVRGS
ncbi:MAG: hypothetical protein WDZ39_00850 [Candidatus Spechtbacterales bacterium]